MNNKGVIGTLFDMSFTEFVTTRVIKVLFILGILGAAIGAIAVIVTGFNAGAGKGVLAIIFSPVVFLLYVLLARIWCEMIIVVFRIAENTGRMLEQNKTQ